MGYNVNSDLVKGDDLFFYVVSGDTATSGTSTVVAFATSCSLQIDGETIDTSNKMSCQWNSNLAGKNSYTVNVDALYTNKEGAYSFDALMKFMIEGDPIGWAIGPAAKFVGDCEDNPFTLKEGAIFYSGKGLITSLSLNAGNNEVASCSLTLTGSGAIEQNGYTD